MTPKPAVIKAPTVNASKPVDLIDQGGSNARSLVETFFGPAPSCPDCKREYQKARGAR